MTQETKVTQQAEAIADGWLALGPAFRTKEVLVGMIENEFASTEAADALLRECYEPMMLLAQSDKNPQTRKIAAMLAARIDMTIAEWDDDEPREDWWNYQRDFAAMREALASTEAADALEVAWLIELGSSEPCEPRYWGGSKGWTSDHQEAVRYCREIDAFRAAEAMSAGAPDEYRVCEHIWQDTRNEQSGQTEAELLREVLESIQRHAACPVGHPKALEFIAEEARQALAKSESEYDRLKAQKDDILSKRHDADANKAGGLWYRRWRAAQDEIARLNATQGEGA